MVMKSVLGVARSRGVKCVCGITIALPLLYRTISLGFNDG
jgi:hypothetical protein